jgi:hypothetical protein
MHEVPAWAIGSQQGNLDAGAAAFGHSELGYVATPDFGFYPTGVGRIHFSSTLVKAMPFRARL